MTTSFKKKLIGITATVVAFGAVFGAIYYVNFVYLPGKQQTATVDIAVTEPSTPKEYHYTVSTANAQAAAATDAKSGDLDTSTAAPGAPSANIDSGGEKITGADGAYHGEQPVATVPASTPAAAPTSKPVATTPSSGTNVGTATSKPADSKPSTGTTNKPTTPAPVEKASAPSKPSSDTPQNGDTRVVNGQKQVYDEVFGWGTDTSGGTPDYIEMGPDTGNYVGEMG